ncbi:hypothetical protein EV421DRAFT_1729453 [Armillaria borealis]|uniref:Uncharacterized protein n=1 Tax=Armillaria borealis TaxID=47425 RepID=A0AA39K994_9AGAR|nr:hypothetical protein EV421DRAFT_1729453 [Armillaria borealis]
MGMNTFMSHFTHLEVLKIAWPKPMLPPLYFYNAQILREGGFFFMHTISVWSQVLKRMGLPVVDTAIIRPGINTDPFEWFVDKGAWYDSEKVCSVYLSGETAIMKGLGSFLKILGSAMTEVNIKMDDEHCAFPTHLGSNTDLKKISIDTHVVLAGQVYEMLSTLPAHLSVEEVVIMVKGCMAIPVIPVVFRPLNSLLQRNIFWDLPANFTVEYTGPSSHSASLPIKTITIQDLSPPFLCILNGPSTLTTKKHEFQDVSATMLSKECDKIIVAACKEREQMRHKVTMIEQI